MNPDPIDRILDLFARNGGESYGEDVTQLSHALQVAALALEEDAGDALVAAALLHDVGQLLDGAGEAAARHGRDARHERSGAALLAETFPPGVTEPVRLHVEAKRYLCAVEPAYLTGLSGASALSLRLQGGPMDEEECRAFRTSPFWRDAVRLRRWDDGGKSSERVPPAIGSFRPLLARVASSSRG